MPVASKHSRGALDRQTVISLIIWFYPLSFIVMMFSSGNLNYVHGFQLLWCTSSFLLLIFVCGTLRKPSKTVVTLCFVLVVNFYSTSISSLQSGNFTSYNIIPKYAMVIAILVLFDQFRSMRFSEIMLLMKPLAKLIIFVTPIYLMIAGEKEFGRYLFFSMHSNVGGEILFASFCCVLAYSNSRDAIFFSFLVIFSCYLLQSRAAMLASLILLSLYFTINLRKTITARLVILVLYMFVLFLIASIIFNFGSFQQAVLASINSAFLLDHEYRGFGTGFAGRSDTWYYARTVFLSNPIFGVGLDNTGHTSAGSVIHGAPFIFLAEFGLFSLIIGAVILKSTLHASRSDYYHTAVIMCSLLILFFQARSFGLNFFPMLFWIAVLPWSKRKESYK